MTLRETVLIRALELGGESAINKTGAVERISGDNPLTSIYFLCFYFEKRIHTPNFCRFERSTYQWKALEKIFRFRLIGKYFHF